MDLSALNIFMTSQARKKIEEAYFLILSLFLMLLISSATSEF